MTATWCNNGLDPVDQNILNKQATGVFTLHLYTDGGALAVTDTVASRTECSVSGYASVALTGANWTGSTTGGVATYTYPSVTFTFNSYGGGVTAYGYYITCFISSTTYLVAEQAFASSYGIPSGGGSLVVNLTETLTYA